MTALEDWLGRNGMAPYVFAARIGIAPNTMYRLLGRRRGKPRHSARLLLDTDTLRTVSLYTGIAIGTLVEDICGEREKNAGRPHSAHAGECEPVVDDTGLRGDVHGSLPALGKP